MLRSLLLIMVALALVASLAIPAGAQETAPTADRTWYDGLGKNRQGELKKRYQAFKKLPKEKQEAVLKAAKEGKPILSEQQRANLQKLRKLSYLERVRLYTLAAELHAARNFRPEEFKKAMNAPDRAAALRDLLAEQRTMMYLRTLPEDQRRELMRLSPEERKQTIRDLYVKESKERLAELEAQRPRVAELRIAAEGGDKEAKRQLKQMLADLKTLDLLMQRLEPEKRAAVMTELRELSIDDAANKIRKALQNQWQAEIKRNKEDRKEGRGQFQPERNGNRSPDSRRKRD